MKKLLTIITIFAALSLAACTKEPQPQEPPVSCEVFNTGIAKVVNNQPDPYYIYFDAVLKATVAANSTAEITLGPDTYAFLAEQKSGYIVYPTKFTATVVVVQCNTRTVTF